LVPNGIELSRLASPGWYRMKFKHRAGQVGSSELLGGQVARLN
jgi:hypothetical protein